MIDRRTQAANIIARALLDYAAPTHLAFHERYAAATAALAHVDAHLARPAAPLLGTQHDAPEVVVDIGDERGEQLVADVERRWHDLDTLGQPGWLARARNWLLEDRRRA